MNNIEEIIKRNIDVKNDFTYSLGNVVEELNTLVQKERIEERLNMLPPAIKRNDQRFNLFVVKQEDGFWEVSYAKGEYYCDRDHLVREEEYVLLHGVQDVKLSDCIDHMFEFLEKLKGACEVCNRPSSKLNEDGICPDCL